MVWNTTTNVTVTTLKLPFERKRNLCMLLRIEEGLDIYIEQRVLLSITFNNLEICNSIQAYENSVESLTR